MWNLYTSIFEPLKEASARDRKSCYNPEAVKIGRRNFPVRVMVLERHCFQKMSAKTWWTQDRKKSKYF